MQKKCENCKHQLPDHNVSEFCILPTEDLHCENYVRDMTKIKPKKQPVIYEDATKDLLQTISVGKKI
jgi:hypothetical protein